MALSSSSGRAMRPVRRRAPLTPLPLDTGAFRLWVLRSNSTSCPAHALDVVARSIVFVHCVLQKNEGLPYGAIDCISMNRCV